MVSLRKGGPDLVRSVALILATAVLFLSHSGRTAAEVYGAAISQVPAAKTFAKPFLSAEAYRLARPTLPSAELRLTYDGSGSDATGQSIDGKTMLTLASDWR